LTAQPPAATLRRALPVAELPFDLIEVKLAAPQIRPDTVAKADVIARLCSSRSSFATVVAPAGYGKTTLLAPMGRG
jgi:ATP/maltotriose-dependent transcriptional regulator MalT